MVGREKNNVLKNESITYSSRRVTQPAEEHRPRFADSRSQPREARPQRQPPQRADARGPAAPQEGPGGGSGKQPGGSAIKKLCFRFYGNVFVI